MYSEILILAMLRQGPRHGYEIKKDIDRALGGMITLNNKTLYLDLKHFEEIGAVTRQVIPQEGKPNRHLYQLTERGIELLQAYLRDFPASQAGSDAEFFTRVAFFDYLEVPEREAILSVRLAYLEGRLSYLRTLQHLAEAEDCAPNMGISMSHAQRVLAFHTRRIRDEYAWIASWLEELQTPR
jgi:DNA-binding PadR family transcriptional regulator